MTKEEWQSSQDPQAMLKFLRTNEKASIRKARLFSLVCCRSIWHVLVDERCTNAVEVAEYHVEGAVSDRDLRKAHLPAIHAMEDAAGDTESAEFGCPAWHGASAVAQCTELHEPERHAESVAREVEQAVETYASEPETITLARVGRANFLRDIFNPFYGAKPQASWLTWNSGAIPRAALAAYQERSLPSGHLDNARLAVIADMLEEAGCRDEDVLSHLRKVDAVHVRGCFAVDLLLGKE